MNDGLKRILGLLGDEKRIYYFVEDHEVKQEDFQYCQTLYQIVFGPKGYVETLGPTWNMIHDPRFMQIENSFIKNRRAFFGGNADSGKQYIFADNTFTSSITDLEQYAEILGEGRNYYNVIVHPEAKCPIRRWLERTQTGITSIIPHADLACSCPSNGDPHALKDAPAEEVWALIRQECPNRAFEQSGMTSDYGDMVFDLLTKCDLVGLIADYAITPLIDSYVYMETGEDVVDHREFVSDPHGANHQKVLKEVDLLETALTQRAVMRMTATEVLDSIGFGKQIENLTGENEIELDDLERDELLRIVYESNWPEDKAKVMSELMLFISTRHAKTLEERRAIHIQQCKEDSQKTIQGLLKGTIQPINPSTEGVVEIPKDENEKEVLFYADLMAALQKNPFKAELFMLYTDAELKGNRAVVEMLAPIFADPNYSLDEIGYYNFLKAIAAGVLTDGNRRNIRAGKEDAIAGTETTGTYKKSVVHYEAEYNGPNDRPSNDPKR
jgi:hypothetical protein